MKLTAFDLHLHLGTLRLTDSGEGRPDAADYMNAAQSLLDQLAACDATLLQRLARGRDPALRELAANLLFEQNGWLPEHSIASAAHAMCGFKDVWRRVSRVG